MTLQLLFYLAGLILLVVAAFAVPAHRIQLGWLGLACWLFASAILPALT